MICQRPMVDSVVFGWKVLYPIPSGWNLGFHDPLFFHSSWGIGDHQVSRRVATFLRTAASLGQPSKGVCPPPLPQGWGVGVAA